MDCSVPAGRDTPIRLIDPQVPEEERRTPGAGSFGEMVSWWIEAYDTGAWRYHADSDTWDYRPELLGERQQSSGLI